MRTWWSRSSLPQWLDMSDRCDPQGAELIDAHVHVFPPEVVRRRVEYLDRDERFKQLYSEPAARMASAEQVLEHMDQGGVDLSVIFGFAFRDLGLCREVNDYVIEAVGSHPGRLAGLACVPLGDAGAAAELERCLEAGMRGCGELAPAADSADMDALRDLACHLRERGLPLLIHASEPVGHTYPGKGAFTPEACVALAESCPGVTMVLAHFGGGLFAYELMPEVRQALSTVVYDTAAMPYLYDPKVYEAVALIAGPQKLLFGSDYPLLPSVRCLEGLDRLPAESQEAIRSGNARRVYGV